MERICWSICLWTSSHSVVLGWPGTHKNPSASAFQALGLKVCTTRPNSRAFCHFCEVDHLDPHSFDKFIFTYEHWLLFIIWCLRDIVTTLSSVSPLERSLALSSLRAAAKSEPSSKLRKQLRKQPDSVDSVNSCVSSCLSNTTSSHGTRKRFQIYSKSPFYRAASACEALGTEGPLGQAKSLEDRPQFISRGTFNPEKGKQKLKNVKNSPQKTKETPEGTVASGRKKTVDPDCSSAKQLPPFGNNEFMVWMTDVSLCG